MEWSRFKKIFVILIILGGMAPGAAYGQFPRRKPKKESEEVRKLREEIKLLRLRKQKLSLENSLKREELNRKLSRLRAQTRVLREENAKEREIMNRESAKLRRERNKINFDNLKLRTMQTKLRLSLIRLKNDLTKRRYRDQWEKEVNRPMVYTSQPYRNGKLIISDRRIVLTGPIFMGMADRIIERIHFYNNKSTRHPIFLIIEASPGGSVMAGVRIQQAMKASRAPVYVVVKSYAASMAAVILASAKRSYAMPNAIILHHQVSSWNRGNITQQKERLKITQEWMRRIATPVAKKMGISLNEFVRRMYKNNSNGDWREFATRAVRLKWVDRLVYQVEERGVRKLAPPRRRLRFFFRRRRGGVMEEKRDARGKPFMVLPRLAPHDVYFLYNPDGYYRLADR